MALHQHNLSSNNLYKILAVIHSLDGTHPDGIEKPIHLKLNTFGNYATIVQFLNHPKIGKKLVSYINMLQKDYVMFFSCHLSSLNIVFNICSSMISLKVSSLI